MRKLVFLSLFAGAFFFQNLSSVNLAEAESGEVICKKVPNLQVGQKLILGKVAVTVTELTHKNNSRREIVGFKLKTSGPGLSYVVKAGGDGFYGSELEWKNKEAISQVTYCVGNTLSENKEVFASIW